MFRRVLVGDNERVLLIRNKRFVDILGPGEHWIFTLGRGVELERHNVRGLVVSTEWAEFILKQRPELAARYFAFVETNDAQVTLVSLDGRIARVIAPGNRAIFWRGLVEISFEVIDVRENPEVPQRVLAPLARLGRESLATF